MEEQSKPDQAPEFDRDAALEGMERFGELLHRATRNAKAAKEAESSRSFAARAVAANEAGIRSAIAAGVSPRGVENMLVESLPNIPRAELRVALQKLLEKLHGRSTERPKPMQNKTLTKEPVARRPASTDAGSQSRPRSTTATSDLPSWADGSDRQPGESDENYLLRKQFEGDPQEKRKFIGEHNT